MTDIDWGIGDSRGDWEPDEPSLFAVAAIVSWLFFTPDLSRTVTFRSVGWQKSISNHLYRSG